MKTRSHAAKGKEESPQHFQLFNKLPPELRCAVWKCSLTPGIHQASRKTPCGEKPPWVSRYVTHITPPPLPVALHVCKESREEALRHLKVYKRCQCIKRDKPSFSYYNPESDILALRAGRIIGDISWVSFKSVLIWVGRPSSEVSLAEALKPSFATTERILLAEPHLSGRVARFKLPHVFMEMSKCWPFKKVVIVDEPWGRLSNFRQDWEEKITCLASDIPHPRICFARVLLDCICRDQRECRKRYRAGLSHDVFRREMRDYQ